MYFVSVAVSVGYHNPCSSGASNKRLERSRHKRASLLSCVGEPYATRDPMKESTDDSKIAIGFAWYRPEQWQRVRDISEDADDLADTYLEWLQLAEENFNRLRSYGVAIEKIDIDSEQLILWCNEQGLEITGESRSSYAADKLRQLHENRSIISGRT